MFLYSNFRILSDSWMVHHSNSKLNTGNSWWLRHHFWNTRLFNSDGSVIWMSCRIQNMEFYGLILQYNCQCYFSQISTERYRIKMEPVEVLNILGKFGFRVVDSTFSKNGRIIWTIEKRNFETDSSSRNLGRELWAVTRHSPTMNRLKTAPQ